MTVQIILLLILGILTCVCYFKVAYRIIEEKFLSGISFLGILTLIALLSLLLLSITLNERFNLEQQLKEKCPEYEKVENVYKLKE